jgi:hypothetical protein
MSAAEQNLRSVNVGTIVVQALHRTGQEDS